MKIYAYLLVLLFIVSACTKEKEIIIEKQVVVEKDGSGQTSLVFDSRYGDADFELNKSYDYKLKNSSGEFDLKYEFKKLRYWVSNVVLIAENGEEHKVPDAYYLIEETEAQNVQDGSFNKVYPATKREEVIIKNIPAGKYKAVKFAIGIDKKYNDNLTLNAGELSPLKGMANEDWMWFTSYIFTKASGKIFYGAEDKLFTFDTGSNEQYQEKTIDFGQSIDITSKTTSKINLQVDVKKIIDFELPWVNNIVGATTPDLMTKLTGNYIEAISLKAVESVEKGTVK